MSQTLNITERLAIPPEAFIRALAELEVDKYVLLCGNCKTPLERKTVMLEYEFGSAYCSEYHCSGCPNKIMPIPRASALGQFLSRRVI